MNLSAYPKLRDLTLEHASIDDRYNLRTPPSLVRFTLCGVFANVYPRPEEIKMPATNLATVVVNGPSSIRFLAYAIRQGLNKACLRHLSISDFITYSNVGGRFIENDLNLLRSIPGYDALQNIEVLILKDDNVCDSDFHAVSTLFPAVQHLELESSRITEGFVSDMIQRPDSKIHTVVLRNCTAVSQTIIKFSKVRNVEVKFTRQARSETGGERRIHLE